MGNLIEDAEAVAPAATDKDRIRSLEAQLEATEKRLAALRVSKFRLPEGKPNRRKASGTFLRLIVPDSHGSMIDKPAAAAMLSDLDSLTPAEVVWLGDHMDCGGWLAEHHTLGYVNDHHYSVAEDEDAANQFLDAVQKRTTGATHHYLEGNHEWRAEQTIAKAPKMNAKDAARFMDRNGPAAVLNLKARGISYYRRSERHMGLNTHGVIKLGKCMFTHGLRTSSNAPASYADRYGGNIVFGHTHRVQAGIFRNVHVGEFGAWNPGCLCQLQPLWRHTDPTNWSHGYGLQVVEKGGEFLYIHVPIVNGVSFLRLLAAKLSA